MKKQQISKIVFIFIIFIFFTSCQKSKQDKIIGEWANQPMENTTIETSYEQTWTFDASANLIITETDTSYQGYYYITSKNMGISGYFVQITNVSGLLDGRYKIKQLDEGKLSLHRIELANGNTAGAFLWRELLKK